MLDATERGPSRRRWRTHGSQRRRLPDSSWESSTRTSRSDDPRSGVGRGRGRERRRGGGGQRCAGRCRRPRRVDVAGPLPAVHGDDARRSPTPRVRDSRSPSGRPGTARTANGMARRRRAGGPAARGGVTRRLQRSTRSPTVSSSSSSRAMRTKDAVAVTLTLVNTQSARPGEKDAFAWFRPSVTARAVGSTPRGTPSRGARRRRRARDRAARSCSSGTCGPSPSVTVVRWPGAATPRTRSPRPTSRDTSFCSARRRGATISTCR